jgi:tripartite ATP-independent transporter DctM subunit
MSGVSLAAASVMAKIAMPNMRRHGYSEPLAAGAIGIGATLDILIPPSVAMVVYGIMTETSIGKLLIAGVIPGIILGILLALAIISWVTIKPSHAPKVQRRPWAYRIRTLRRIWLSLLLICVVMVLLYTGIATPTEVGAVGAFLAAMIGVFTRRLTWQGGLEALRGTVVTTAMIFLILIGGMLFGYYITLSQIPQQIINSIIEMNLNRYVVMIGIIVGYFIISMFMDEIPLMLITLQLTFPLVISLKFDPIWFGVVTMMMIAMGLVFPPVGVIAFIISATANVDLVKVYRGTSLLMIAIVVTTVLLFIFPEIALWLPATMH